MSQQERQGDGVSMVFGQRQICSFCSQRGYMVFWGQSLVYMCRWIVMGLLRGLRGQRMIIRYRIDGREVLWDVIWYRRVQVLVGTNTLGYQNFQRLCLYLFGFWLGFRGFWGRLRFCLCFFCLVRIRFILWGGRGSSECQVGGLGDLGRLFQMVFIVFLVGLGIFFSFCGGGRCF